MRKCWYCNKEIKNENDKEHVGICGKCYRDNFEVDNKLIRELIKYQTDKDQKIDDLKTKLAESEERNKDLVKALNGEVFINYKVPMENAQLKQKLAEKEKEIDKLEDKLHHYYEETLNKGICGLCDHLRGEYKTDFAIKQLEKVKHELVNKVSPVNLSYTEYVQEVFNEINQQIKELKEGK